MLLYGTVYDMAGVSLQSQSPSLYSFEVKCITYPDVHCVGFTPVNQAFFKPPDCGAGRGNAIRKDKTVSQMSIYHWEDKPL